MYCMKNLSLLLLVGGLVLVTSCDPAVSTDATDAEEHLIGLRLSDATRAGSTAATTYRGILLTTTGTGTEYKWKYTGRHGSYRGPEVDPDYRDVIPDTLRPWLTPCHTNPTTGAWLEDGDAWGLRAPYGSYGLTLVSPAVYPKSYLSHDAAIYSPGIETVEQWGYHHWRTYAQANDHNETVVRIASPHAVSITGNYMNASADPSGRPVYDVPDAVVLYERRATMDIRLRCGDDLASATVNSLSLQNVYEEGWYCFAVDSIIDVTLGTTPEVLIASPMTFLHGAEPVTVASDVCFLPFQYNKAQQYDADQYVYALPELVFDLNGVLTYTMRLPFDMKASTHYTLTVTLNSAFVRFDLTANDWEDGGTHPITPDGGIVAYDGSPLLTITPTNWQPGGSIDAEGIHLSN